MKKTKNGEEKIERFKAARKKLDGGFTCLLRHGRPEKWGRKDSITNRGKKRGDAQRSKRKGNKGGRRDASVPLGEKGG